MDIQTVHESMLKQTVLYKQAFDASALWNAPKAALTWFFGTADIAANVALGVLGAAAAAGAGVGAFGSYITSHGKQDEDTVKKEYENERLKADVGYVASRLEDEWNRSKTATKPKAARVLNV